MKVNSNKLVEVNTTIDADVSWHMSSDDMQYKQCV